jgi:cyclic pyranopterin phosphate synthase
VNELTHLDGSGRARMVDVGGKPETLRRAVAEASVRISEALADAISAGTTPKGDVLTVARLAGIAAAKRTDELIPLCHTLPLDHVHVEAVVQRPFIRLRATASTTARTGVEMEALTAVTVAALAVIDMGKAIDRGMTIESVRVVEKTGGQRGDWTEPAGTGGTPT